MRRLTIAAAIACALVGATPTLAQAQVYISPMVGSTFGHDAPATKLSTGAALTFLGKAAGFEAEFGYTPDFFNQSNDLVLVGDSNLTTFTGNVLVGLGSGRVKPYGIVGLGLMRSRINAGDLFDAVTTNDWAVNAGAGVMVPVANRINVRGDIRYFRSLQDPSNDNDVDVTLGKFDFWRASGSLMFGF